MSIKKVFLLDIEHQHPQLLHRCILKKKGIFRNHHVDAFSAFGDKYENIGQLPLMMNTTHGRH